MEIMEISQVDQVLLFELLFKTRRPSVELELPSNSDEALLLLASATTEVKEKREVAKIKGYLSETVPAYTDLDFKSHFRLNRQSVEVLLQRLGPAHAQQAAGRPPTPLTDRVLLGLWFLANLETFRQVSERFNVSKGHAHDIYKSFLEDVATLAGDLIKWPTNAEARNTIMKFNSIRGEYSFPNVFGCIDGMHVRISCPKADGSSYVNRKQFPSVILQAVCDSELRFTNVFAGWPGASHDARVYRRSELGRLILDDPASIIPEGAHLLGDAAYPLSEAMMCPFRNNGHLTQRQRRFNTKLSSTRIVIEQAFGHLIGRFRRLRCLEMKRTVQMGLVVKVACILHNLCVDQADEAPDVEIDLELDMPDEPGNGNLQARQKRDVLADMF